MTTNEIITSTIAFASGLSSTFIVDGIKKWNKRKNDKKFIISYLEYSILPILPKLKGMYVFAIEFIEATGLDEHIIEAFEDFNSNVLKGLSYSEYFQIFKFDKENNNKEFTLSVEIIAIIDFLSQHLPLKLIDDYFAKINNHLSETNNKGNISHITDCNFCVKTKAGAIQHINGQIRSVEQLEEKIRTLITSK